MLTRTQGQGQDQGLDLQGQGQDQGLQAQGQDQGLKVQGQDQGLDLQGQGQDQGPDQGLIITCTNSILETRNLTVTYMLVILQYVKTAKKYKTIIFTTYQQYITEKSHQMTNKRHDFNLFVDLFSTLCPDTFLAYCFSDYL